MLSSWNSFNLLEECFNHLWSQVFNKFIDESINNSDCFLMLSLLAFPYKVNQLRCQSILLTQEYYHWGRSFKKLSMSAFIKQEFGNLLVNDPL